MNTVDELFQTVTAETDTPFITNQFHLDEPVFVESDLLLIRKNGLMRWALSQPEITLQDEIFDWRKLPTTLRQLMLAEVFEGLQSLVQYALPFRRLGRIVIMAVLPQPVESLRVEVIQPVKQVEPPRQQRYLDPPFPVLGFGLASPALQALQARAIRRVMQGQVDQIGELLSPIFTQLAKEEQITVSELVYYATTMHLLISGAWRQMDYFWPLVQLERLAGQVVSRNPVHIQEVFHQFLLDGKPIEWGDENTLRLTS